MHLEAERAYRGSVIQTAWSSNVAVIQVLYTLRTADWTFHGVRVETLDQGWEVSSDATKLLWVLEDHQGLRTWQECRQRPFIIDGELEHDIEKIVGHYESQTGSVYYAVKWVDFECPTWELEDDLSSCQLITEYCMHLPGSDWGII